MLSRVLKPVFVYNLILLITFSFSVNSYEDIQNIIIFFYILFHITFIYFVFYHYNFLIYFLGLFYGVMFDVLLLNSIGCHLLCYIIFISLFVFFKKYLFLLSSFQITVTIFIALIIILYSEMFFAYTIHNIYFSSYQIIKYTIFSSIIFLPSIFLLNKLDI